MKLKLTSCLLTIAVSFLSVAAFGQERVDYLDPQLNLVKDSLTSKFIRKVSSVNDSVHNVTINYRTGELMMTGSYKDKGLQLENGDFKYFYANGVVESEGKYRNGYKVGTWKRWSYDGSTKPDRLYADENFKKTNRTTGSAKFPGGMAALQKMVDDSLLYPVEARERGIEGTVYVTFLIDASGDVRQPEVTDGVHYLLDDEALRFVSTMPTWTPATRNGLPVESSFIMPVTFSLMRKGAAE